MDRDRTDGKTLAQKLAFLFGVTFLLAGIAGFIPGITTNLYDGLEFAGDDGNAELLGLFKVSVLHNIVHALFAIGILMAATHRGALKYLLYSGILYIVLFVMGIVDLGDWVPIDNTDNYLHIGLALGLLGAWAASKGAEDPDHRASGDRDRDRMGTTPA
ncbi:MAG: DUF4383 domain-containing protein [Actinobacteria bacterium]|nr:DUF4383 domain-containing protein [Actinomycetota bacterium]